MCNSDYIVPITTEWVLAEMGTLIEAGGPHSAHTCRCSNRPFTAASHPSQRSRRPKHRIICCEAGTVQRMKFDEFSVLNKPNARSSYECVEQDGFAWLQETPKDFSDRLN